MSIERDKFLTEAMGECWHDSFTRHEETFDNRYVSYTCDKCGIESSYAPSFPHIEFNEWWGFGKLWE